MSFEPQKVIEFDKGKQIGQTLTQHADNIPYEDTTVGAELDSINTHLSGIKVKHVELTNVAVSSGGTFTLPSRFNTLPVLNVGLKNNIGFTLTHWSSNGYWCAYAPSNAGQTLSAVEVEYLDVPIVNE